MVNAIETKLCTDCDTPLDDDAETEPLYECGQCGTTFGKSGSADGESARCPDCNKFSSRIGEVHEGCETPIEEAADGWKCEECNTGYTEQAEAEECCKEEEEEEPSPFDAARAAAHEADLAVARARDEILCGWCGHKRGGHGKSPYGWPQGCNECPGKFCPGDPKVV